MRDEWCGAGRQPYSWCGRSIRLRRRWRRRGRVHGRQLRDRHATERGGPGVHLGLRGANDHGDAQRHLLPRRRGRDAVRLLLPRAAQQRRRLLRLHAGGRLRVRVRHERCANAMCRRHLQQRNAAGLAWRLPRLRPEHLQRGGWSRVVRGVPCGLGQRDEHGQCGAEQLLAVARLLYLRRTGREHPRCMCRWQRLSRLWARRYHQRGWHCCEPARHRTLPVRLLLGGERGQHLQLRAPAGLVYFRSSAARARALSRKRLLRWRQQPRRSGRQPGLPARLVARGGRERHGGGCGEQRCQRLHVPTSAAAAALAAAAESTTAESTAAESAAAESAAA